MSNRAWVGLTWVSMIAVAPHAATAAEPVSLQSLLREMTDRDAVARFPDPAYTCRQYSSYDRRSTSPEDAAGWFANDDVGQFIRTEDVGNRREFVMMDADGPGAVVRIWSANPAGTLRIYLDGSPGPAIEARLDEVLGGKWKAGGVTVGEPFAGEHSRGWNLYLPIPYASHCKITSDEGKFYYQINYRTYAPGTRVKSFSRDELPALKADVEAAATKLEGVDSEPQLQLSPAAAVASGDSRVVLESNGPGAVTRVSIGLSAENIADALRTTIVVGEFDGEQTIWVPVGDLVSQVGRAGKFSDWYRRVNKAEQLECAWVMPFQRNAVIRVLNLGSQTVNVRGGASTKAWTWDDRSMHFHASWRQEYPIHTRAGRGTTDWNYLEAAGQGVYVGDSLSVANPVEAWWGEGDEKISVDGEKFPSHFGTGTEDYYGYAWCCNVPFQRPFHAQSRCDGEKTNNNWGVSTVTRVRSLDAVPFTTSLKFDMEVWHWKECDVGYAATTFWYARPGAAANRKPDPEQAKRGEIKTPPLPPPFKIAGALECETSLTVAKSAGLAAEVQEMRQFGERRWSGEKQLWVQARKVGDFVELRLPAPNAARHRLTLYATKSWDFGIVRVTVNGAAAGEPLDMLGGEKDKAVPS